MLTVLITLSSFYALDTAPVAGTLHTNPRTDRTTAAAPSAAVPTITDGQQITEGFGPYHSRLSDTIVPGNSTGSSRTYFVDLRTTFPLRTLLVNLSTSLLQQASDPNQLPGGADVLPPAANWSWGILDSGVNDTAHWNFTTPGLAYRIAPWANASFEIVGTSDFSATVTAYAGLTNGATSPALGIIVHTSSPQIAVNLTKRDPHVTGLLGALAPALVRWSLVSAVPTTWNSTTGNATFHFGAALAIAKLTASAGAVSMLDVPAGTWGDGNSLPTGMPLNLSIELVSKGGSTGYFPALAAYHAYLVALVGALARAGIPIRYWNIGNEIPIGSNLSTAAAFVTLYNMAAAVVHNASPSALVSSDVFVRPNLIKYFATRIHGADFLDFHYYPANGPCPSVATFCAPDGIGGYQPDPTILSRSALFAKGAVFPPPAVCQQDWYNGTHTWVPILDTESNLNAYPNAIQNSTSIAYGTDPRQQTLFAAAWVDSEMMDAAMVNVSAVTYFALQGPYGAPGTVTHPYGGFGYSLISGPGPNDVRYAPYWALDLWRTNVPPGSRGLLVNSSNPFLVHAYAVTNGSGVTVVLSNRNALPTTIRVNVSGAVVHAATEQLLDATTYKMAYDPSTHSTTVTLSTVVRRVLPSGWMANITIDGYGLAVVQFAAGSPPPGGHVVIGAAETSAARPAVAQPSPGGPTRSAPFDPESQGSTALPVRTEQRTPARTARPTLRLALENPRSGTAAHDLAALPGARSAHCVSRRPGGIRG